MDNKWFHAQKISFFATLLLTVLAVITIFIIPTPTKFQYNALQTIVALLMAVNAYTIPGSLAISKEIPELKIGRAVGAVVVFLLVYYFVPLQL